MTPSYSITKRFRSDRGMVLLVTLLCMLLSTGFGEANKLRPFRGSVYATAEVLDGEGPERLYRVTGTGNATHLGKFRIVSLTTADQSTQPGRVSGEPVFTAANGDQLYATFTGTATLIGENTLNIERNYEVTGGTGRFVNASGYFTGNSTGTLDENGNPLPGTITFEGYIDY